MFEDAALSVSVSPSASANTPDSEISLLVPASRLAMSAMGWATVGASLTVTVNVSDTVPPFSSLAVTVSSAVPRPIASTHSSTDGEYWTKPTDTKSSLDSAVIVKASPSASVNTSDRSTVTSPPTTSGPTSEIGDATLGGLLRGGAGGACGSGSASPGRFNAPSSPSVPGLLPCEAGSSTVTCMPLYTPVADDTNTRITCSGSRSASACDVMLMVWGSLQFDAVNVKVDGDTDTACQSHV